MLGMLMVGDTKMLPSLVGETGKLMIKELCDKDHRDMHRRVIHCGEASKSNWMVECNKERLNHSR